jgi:hypothetical protein
MKVPIPGIEAVELPGAMPVTLARVDRARWSDVAQAFREGGRRLVALWGADRRAAAGGFAVLAAYAAPEGLCGGGRALGAHAPTYPPLRRGFY